MLALEMMTKDPVVITADELISRAAELMRDSEVGLIPVVEDMEGMELVGVITDRDIAIRCVARTHLPVCQVRVHMTSRNLRTVAPGADGDEVLTLMQRDHLRGLPVVSDGNHLEGVISRTDAMPIRSRWSASPSCRW